MRPLTVLNFLVAGIGLAYALVAPANQALTLPMLPVSSNHSIAGTSSMSIKAWADSARKGPYQQGTAPQHAITVLALLFEGRQAPAKAADNIAALYNPLIQQHVPQSSVFGLWTIICEAIRMLGGNVEIDLRLIGLLNAMARLPDVTDQTGRPIGPGGGFSGLYWKDLPGLAIIFREYAIGEFWRPTNFDSEAVDKKCSWNADIEPGSSEMPDEADWTDAQRQTLINVTTFGALYFVHGETDLGMSFHAKASLEDGLEEPYRTPIEIRRARTNVPPAAAWIFYAGEKIYQLCARGKLDIDRDCSLDRWNLWRITFDNIGRNPALSLYVRYYAQRAATSMRKLGPQE